MMEDENKTKGMPLLGEEFPRMSVTTTHGVLDLPDHFKGKWFVLFSHPADYTPVCTTEFVAFEKRAKQFRDMDTELIGLSIDQVFSHIKWVQWIKEKLDVDISFPVIADDRGEVATRLGMLHPGKGSNTVRAVFLVDPRGILRTMLYYPQEIGRNMDEILRAVKALKTADANKVAMPANWPENELIKDKVIIPPATDTKSAEERPKKYDCYDWWFCYKDLE